MKYIYAIEYIRNDKYESITLPARTLAGAVRGAKKLLRWTDILTKAELTFPAGDIKPK